MYNNETPFSVHGLISYMNCQQVRRKGRDSSLSTSCHHVAGRYQAFIRTEHSADELNFDDPSDNFLNSKLRNSNIWKRLCEPCSCPSCIFLPLLFNSRLLLGPNTLLSTLFLDTIINTLSLCEIHKTWRTCRHDNTQNYSSLSIKLPDFRQRKGNILRETSLKTW
jgi:hypothetical protein